MKRRKKYPKRDNLERVHNSMVISLVKISFYFIYQWKYLFYDKLTEISFMSKNETNKNISRSSCTHLIRNKVEIYLYEISLFVV